MKVLHITTSSKGGAGIAALRLHKALCDEGVLSAFLSINETINFDNEVVKDPFFGYKKPSLFKKIKNKIYPSKKILFERELNKLALQMKFEIVTLPFSNYKIHDHPLFKEADIINLHWIDGIIDYPSFFKNCDKPIVWTFHDMNPFKGIFHYQNDETNNQNVASIFDSKIKQIKEASFQNIKKCTIVSPSKWMLQEVTASNVFPDFAKIEIPNAIDFDVFKIQDNVLLRKEQAISDDEFVILFVSDSIENKRKGFDLLLESLNFIKNSDITILAIGRGIIPEIDGLKIISLGEINSSAKMAECFALADVFVLPSREDNLPNVMLEAFASGTPIIGFEIGGVAEHTVTNVTGILANELTGFALSQAIIELRNSKNKYHKETIRAYAKNNFGLKKQADSYCSVYNSFYE
jgi:glycosyltransferase involved in cell wall biosynthesis